MSSALLWLVLALSTPQVTAPQVIHVQWSYGTGSSCEALWQPWPLEMFRDQYLCIDGKIVYGVTPGEQPPPTMPPAPKPGST